MKAPTDFKDTMFDPANITLGQVSSALRDLTVIGFLVTISWKSRGFYEATKKFFERLTTHMQIMEQGMQTLLSNHLTHIEESLKQMSHRPSQVEAEPESGTKEV